MKLCILFLIAASSFLFAQDVFEGADAPEFFMENVDTIKQKLDAYASSFDTSCISLGLYKEMASMTHKQASEAMEVEVCGSDINGISNAADSVDGCEVMYKHHPQDDCVVVRMPASMDDMNTLCSMSMVDSIQPRSHRTTLRDTVSEGDAAHRANLARVFGEGSTGKGVKIGILSDCVILDVLDNLTSSGDLNSITIITDPLTNQTQNIFPCSSEGSAMAEIIFDLAPDAELFFASAFISLFQFSRNIELLRFEYGCDIIVDDVIYFSEAPFQDDIVAQSADKVTEDGALFFSAGGNFRTNTYAVDFNTTTSSGPAFHFFEIFGGTELVRVSTSPDSTSNLNVFLYWSDSYQMPTEQYFIIVFNDTTGEFIPELSSSQSTRGGEPIPLAFISLPPGIAIRFGFLNFEYNETISQRRIRMLAPRARIPVRPSNTFGHSAARSSFSVAAAFAGTGDPIQPFNTSTITESFSSLGPVNIFFDKDGNILEEGVYTAAQGGEVRMKPDFTAADGVSTSTPGFNPFFGTSAAAPHLAAIAGLILEKSRINERSYMNTVFKLASIDIHTPGSDILSGYGVVDALTSVQIAHGARPHRVFPRYPQSHTLGFKNHPNYDCPHHLSDVDVFSTDCTMDDAASFVQEADDDLALYASKFSYNYHKYPLSIIFDIPIEGSYLLSGGHTIQHIYNHTVVVSIRYKVEAEFHVSKRIKFAALVPEHSYHRHKKIDLGYIDTEPGYSETYAEGQVFSSQTIGSVLNRDHVHLEVSIHEGLHKQLTIDSLSIHVICP